MNYNMGVEFVAKKFHQYIKMGHYITIGRKHTMVPVLLILVMLSGDEERTTFFVCCDPLFSSCARLHG